MWPHTWWGTPAVVPCDVLDCQPHILGVVGVVSPVSPDVSGSVVCFLCHLTERQLIWLWIGPSLHRSSRLSDWGMILLFLWSPYHQHLYWCMMSLMMYFPQKTPGWWHLNMCQSVHLKQACRTAVASSVHTFNQLNVSKQEKRGNMVWLTKMGTGEGFVAARNVRVNMVQGIVSPGGGVDMLWTI